MIKFIKNRNSGFSILTILVMIAGLVVVVGGGYWSYTKYFAEQEFIACTQEAKLCPDGSTVGRVPPTCEFTLCPDPGEFIDPRCAQQAKGRGLGEAYFEVVQFNSESGKCEYVGVSGSGFFGPFGPYADQEQYFDICKAVCEKSTPLIEESPMPVDRSVPIRQDDMVIKLDQIVKSLVPSGSRVALDVVRVSPGTPDTVYVRTRLDWIEFANKIRIDTSQDTTTLRNELKSKLYLDFLNKPILTANEINEVLASCSPDMKASITQLRAPFFNNWTGVHFDPAENFLAIEANATIDSSQNKCKRGVVDLRSGELVCQEIACVID